MSEGTYLMERIRSRCKDDAGCWVWQGHAQKGVMPIINIDGKVIAVRRVVFEQTQGPVKPGHEVVGTCEMPLCVAPGCVEQVTPAERRRRMAAKRDATPPAVKWRPPHSKLSVEKARAIRASEESTAELAQRYGVSLSAIGYVRAGRTWIEATPWTGLGAR